MYYSNIDKGKLGESIAEKYLRKNGYIILEKNFRSKCGEIDIIGKDKDYIVFIEVKTRSSSKFGTPREAVTFTKQNKIYKTAQLYIMEKRLLNFNCRFDVIEVILNTVTNEHSIKLIKNAFQV